MARKSRAREPERDESSRAAGTEDPNLNENEELDASGGVDEDGGLLAEGEPVGAWSDDEDEEPNAFDAAGEDDDEEAYAENEEAPAGYQASSTPSRKPR